MGGVQVVKVRSRNELHHPTTTIAIATAIAIVAQLITTTQTTQATAATTTDLVDYPKDYPIEQS